MRNPGPVVFGWCVLLLAGLAASCAQKPEPLGAVPSARASIDPSATPVASTEPPANTADAPATAPSGALGDRAFGRLVAHLSEPAGKFPSDNFVSNETSYLHVAPALAKRTGGAYIGVGPEQNFTYLAILRPEIAFIVDIRRQNLVEHLLYKALLEHAGTRAELVALLTTRLAGKTLPGPEAKVEELVGWLAQLPRGAPKDGDARTLTLERARALGIELDKDDLAHLAATLKAFSDKGLDVRYSMEGSARKYPSLAELSQARDDDGKLLSFLASEEVFRVVQTMSRENRIVPVVGNLAGEGALPRIAQDLRTRKLDVKVFYSSNVEQYLFEPATWKTWVRNVTALPWSADGRILRVYFDQGKPHPAARKGHRTVSMTFPADAFVARAKGAGWKSWWDVATDSSRD